MLSPVGQRLRQTLRKLPKASPISPAKIVPKIRIIVEFEYIARRRPVGLYGTEVAYPWGGQYLTGEKG
jgi:hypothetical protein